MVKIIKNTEFTARAMQAPDFKNKVPGYNFSYPVLNTIEICNLFIAGGTIEINIERMGKSKWAYDLNTTSLSVERKGVKNVYHICNTEELGTAMMQYCEANSSVLFEKNCETSSRKSKAKIGNQNAKKYNKEVIVDTSPQKTVSTNQQVIVTTNSTNNDEYPTNFVCHMPKFVDAVKNNQDKFCTLDEFLQQSGKTVAEYFYWVMGNKWFDNLNLETCKEFERVGFSMRLAIDNIYNINNYVKANI